MKYLPLVILIFASCVSRPEEKASHSLIDSVYVVSGQLFSLYLDEHIRDTVANGTRFTFKKLPKATYDSLWRNELALEIPVAKPGVEVLTTDDCSVVSYRNGQQETFCVDNGDNSSYTMKGAWKGLLLVSYFAEDGGNDFLISLADGSRYNLGITYLLSPDEKRLVSYADEVETHLNNELSVSRIRPSEVETLLHYEFADVTIADAAWIADNQCLLLIAGLQENEKDPVNLAYYLLTIN